MTLPPTTATDTPVPAVRVVVTVLLPFAFGYFLSYLSRVINAVIADDLAADLGVEAGALGVLTASYFIAFAAFQIPLGVLLDRYGPRRVEAALLIVAGLGSLWFATATSVFELTLARAAIGLGMSACLMAAFKANLLWWPIARLPLLNGVSLACGGIGAIAGSTPVAALLHVTDWRTLFLGMAALIFASSAALLLVTPPDPMRRGSAVTVRDQVQVLRRILAHRQFWRVAAVSVTVQSVALAYLSLWAAEWLRGVDGAAEDTVATAMQNMAIAMTVGYALTGVITDRLHRLGIGPDRVLALACGLFIVNLGILVVPGFGLSAIHWPAFALLGTASVLGYPILSAVFPGTMAGRVNTALNLLCFVLAFAIQSGVGFAIDALAAAAWSVADAHRLVLAVLLGYCIAGYGVYVWPKGPTPAPGHDVTGTGV